MTHTFKIISLLILLVFALSFTTSPAAAQQPPVLAFYYAWFDQNTWASGQSVDLPAEPYASADRGAIERHVAQAQGAGINAFVQSWYGPQVENNQTETNFRVLLEVAQAKGFQAAVDFETSSPFMGNIGSVTNALATLLATHAQHPAYLRYQGKPVIFFWRQQRFTVDDWAAIRSQVDPNRGTYWIAEGTDLSYQAVFDGHHLYSVAWAGSPAGQLAKWGDRVRAYEAENQVDRLWVATAMPGYNDTRLPRGNAFAVPRRNGDYYRETWRGAVASRPDMLIVTSFNEWLEGTQLEPSASYGNLYLDVTRELVAELQGSPLPPPPETPAQPAPLPELVEEQETPSDAAESLVSVVEAPGNELDVSPVAYVAQGPAPEEPYIETDSITNVRSDPTTSSEVVGRLAANQAVSVMGRAADVDWWLIEFEPAPEGEGWVSGEVVEFVGDEAAVPVVTPGEAGDETDAEAETEEADADETATEEEAGDDEPEAETSPPDEADAEASATQPPAQQANLPTLLVPEGGVNIRSGPGLDFELLDRLDEDAVVPVVGKNETGEWWQIEYEAGPDGRAWVAAVVVEFSGESDDLPVVSLSEAVEDAAAPEADVPAVTGSIEGSIEGAIEGSIEATAAINVRSAPSEEGEVLGGLYNGETADVLAVSEDGAWWQIDFADAAGEEAWVAAEFVEFQGERSSVPIFGLGTPTPTIEPSPTPTVTATPTPLSLEQPTLAPTATSVYGATSAAVLAQRGTPDPSLVDSASSDQSSSAVSWEDIPWGILSIIVIAGFIWYQFVFRRRQ